jgi:UPF0271 protein
MVTKGSIKAASGKKITVCADTVCLHGDQPDAAVFAAGLQKALQTVGVIPRAFP